MVIQSPKFICGECDRYEFDPIFHDVEMCSQCGGPIELAEEEEDDYDETD